MAEAQNVAMSWGATSTDDGTVCFRLWAPAQDALSLRIAGNDLPMEAKPDGWFELSRRDVAIGTPYMFVLSDGTAIPDPASRAQARDVHGTALLAASDFAWRNPDWKGRPWEEAIIYELHIGTFTPQGTFSAAIEKLAGLAEIGITALEVMPVAQFSGERGWGYDGVLHYAPHSAYGSPEDFKAFIDAAHGHGIMVLLDVVYNHFGPDGNYINAYAPTFFRSDRETPWGVAIDFGQDAVRRFFIENALYWIGEFKLDGLRLDAVEQIHDTSERHVLTDIAEAVSSAFPDRKVHLVVEDQRNLVTLLARDEKADIGKYTAEWNDDFHHVAHIAATGEGNGHYTPFADDLWHKFALSLQHGFVFPDRDDSPPQLPTGERTYLPPTAFIDFLQNHDQAGNRAFGERLLSLAPESMVQALTAMLLLSPHIPFLFMGEEFGETQPFYFFCDYTGELGDIVRKGRANEAEGFGGLRADKTLDDLPDPNAASTFNGSKLRWDSIDSEHGRTWRSYVKDLIAIRSRLVVPLLVDSDSIATEASVVADGVLALLWTFPKGRLQLRANLSEKPTTVPPVTGDVIFAQAGSAHAAFGREALPAHSVIYALDTGI